MHGNDVKAYEKKCYCWFYSEVKFLTSFGVFSDLVSLTYFTANTIDLCAVKVLLFCVISMFINIEEVSA